VRAGWVRVEFGTGRARVEKFFVQVTNVEPKHMNLISRKIAKQVGVIKLFASIALRSVGLQPGLPDLLLPRGQI